MQISEHTMEADIKKAELTLCHLLCIIAPPETDLLSLELPKVSFLSRQTQDGFCRDRSKLVVTNIFVVVTNVLL